MSKYYIILKEELQASNVTSLCPVSTAVAHMKPRAKRTHITTVAQCHGAQGYRARRDQPDSSDRIPVDQTCTVYSEVASYVDGTEYMQDSLNNDGTQHSQVASYNEGTEDTHNTLYLDDTKHIQVHLHVALEYTIIMIM